MPSCPNCDKSCRPGLIFCLSCGERLTNAAFRATADINPLMLYQTSQIPKFASPYGEGTLMRIEVRTAGAPYPVPLPDDKRIILGRSDLENQIAPNMDFALFNARELGVSRRHAAIDLTDKVATLTDLGSQNGTDLNGARLNPHMVYRLRDHDVICLGKLVLYIHL